MSNDSDVFSLHFVEFVHKSVSELLHACEEILITMQAKVDCFEHAVFLVDIRTHFEDVKLVHSLSL